MKSSHIHRALLLCAIGMFSNQFAHAQTAAPQTSRVPLTPEMLKGENEKVDFSGLADEQNLNVDATDAQPKNGWKTDWQTQKEFPAAVVIDLGQETPLFSIWLYDTNSEGDTTFYAGKPGDWKQIATYDGKAYNSWAQIPLKTKTRYLRVELKSAGANAGELALYRYSDQSWDAYLAQQVLAAQEKQQRAAKLKQAQDEVAQRPVIEMAPFGKLSLVDEVDLGAENPGHLFAQSPENASRIETILGKKARVLNKTQGESAYFTVRVGQFKLLKPGAQYVLNVEYPEDAARSIMVMNGGNETTRGFATGRALGDALHPKYVDNLNESLNLPLSGQYQNWKMLFSLHDRFPQLGFIRGAGERALTSEDGFPVTIAQFSADNIPASQGAAVARIRLFEVLEPQNLNAPLALPQGLPQRHLFWREEMADGVIQSNDAKERGVDNRLDWYRYKARQMHFLGMNTYAKDLLEFGAVQHWDTSPLGGNDWAFFDGNTKDLWGQIVEMMGKEGFGVLPYYEYSGSKGYKGLGNERRAKPLTRDDAYTHIEWIEASNADLTDPDTFEDFKKMLDLTVVRQAKKAPFVGIWLRSRGQMPMSFADATLARFANEANDKKTITRQNLIADKALLQRYETWWFGKRRAFLDAMRDYLVANGVANPIVMFTPVTSEPGVSFSGWDKRFVTDDAKFWTPILNGALGKDDKPTAILTPQQVAQQDLYGQGLVAPPNTWGGWEWQYSNPQADPQTYKNDAGVLMTHAFNRAYTVASSKTFDEFRGQDRLALLRFYSLNENMMFDKAEQEKLGYFVADMESAGPYCMLGEVRAMANGDPTEIGYLSGSNFTRGFPEYARAFNTAFLALPALPSRVVPNASSDAEIVVREITTPNGGTWYAVINTGLEAKSNLKIKLPKKGAIQDAVTKKALGTGGEVTVSLGACAMHTWWTP